MKIILTLSISFLLLTSVAQASKFSAQDTAAWEAWYAASKAALKAAQR